MGDPLVALELANAAQNAEARGSAMVDILVMNVSLVDIVLGVQTNDGGAKGGEQPCVDVDGLKESHALARPRFNRFYPLCKNVHEVINTLGSEAKLLECRFAEEEGEEGEEEDEHVPVGLLFDQAPVLDEDWTSLHFKKADENQAVKDGKPKIVSVMMPLLAQVVRTWIEHVEADEATSANSGDSRRVVMIISGAGKPRNKELDIRSNSTKAAAQIMANFIERSYPGTEVQCIDSGLGVFHYDQNVSFCNEKLLPAIEKLRHPLVCEFGDEWKSRLRCTMALTDGSPARLAALNASMRIYKPNYLHMWQLKTFWYEYQFLRSDLVFNSFETMETKPAISYRDLDNPYKRLVDEVREHRDQFISARASGSEDELAKFWLRKTRKCVLSVLMVQGPEDPEPRFFRGMNLEVSMPTGSLCAERNVIGTALASEPSLRRRDLRMIAVLSMTLGLPSQQAKDGIGGNPRSLPPSPRKSAAGANRSRVRSMSSCASLPSVSLYASELNPISPCGSCLEWLKKIAEINPGFRVVTFSSSDCEEVFMEEISF
mmetsp:Transcript_4026/g.7061  ORF Transcript_4026/g.7061 Transcript_4026/m.7061 type:complete len:544 (-) Transcript_4026:13-1644(-)